VIRRGGLLLSLIAACAPLWAASLPAERGRDGAVSAAEATATQAGVTLLRAGGNAVDAAVATALALAVSHPEAGNLGGGGFAVVRFGDEITTLDFRETAPAAAHAAMYLGADGEPIPDASTLGALAAGVPGTPRGLFALHEKFGALPWSEVVDPAHRLAAEGFPVSRRLHEAIVRNRERLARFPTTAAVWLPAGAPPPIGATMRLPALAATLARYAAEGPRGITGGIVAQAIEETVARSGGVLTAVDLAGYEPVWRPPVRFSAFGWDFASMDLPSSGGIILGQTLGILERLGWREKPRFGADRAHFIAETWRRVFADRYLLGDPATTEARADDLLSPAWLDARAGEIGVARATPSDAVAPWEATSSGALAESAETTHLSVVDGDGNIVAMTTTLNGSFGCGLLVPGAGFLLNNQMDDFATAPGRPNLYGLIQGEANAVGPGKRMLSSMAPTIAWNGGDVVAAGGRGGSRIPTATTQVLLNLIVDGDDLQSAVNRPRLHHQWKPDRLEADSDALGPETAAELERRGHALHFWPVPVKVHAVRHRADGTTEAAADPRGPGVGDVATPEVPELVRQGDSR
jgi:gamma-glutamyltranspeptidase/glutathione hydrolase